MTEAELNKERAWAVVWVILATLFSVAILIGIAAVIGFISDHMNLSTI